MSTTITKPAAAVAKKGDAWLQKMGIGVHRMRQAAPAAPARPQSAAPGARANPPPTPPGRERATPRSVAPPPVVEPVIDLIPEPVPEPEKTPEEMAYEAAAQQIHNAGDTLARAERGSEVIKLKADFDALPSPPAEGVPIADFTAALAALQPKLAMAEQIQNASNFDYSVAVTTRVIRKGRVYMAQSGKVDGQQAINDAMAKAQQQMALALARRDYDAANDLASEARVQANQIVRPYECRIKAEQYKPAFARAEKLLAQKKLPKEFAELKDAYGRAAKDHQSALKGTDHALWEETLTERVRQAYTVIDRMQRASVNEWFDAGAAKPAEPGAPRGIASGLATMPDLAAMDEAKKLEVMGKRMGRDAEGLRRDLTGLYAKALANGVKLDLSPAQIAAAAGYSGTAYGQMNGLLRGSLDTSKVDPAVLDGIKVQIELLQQALARLPTYDPGGFPLFRWETPHGDYLQTRYQVASPVFEIKEFWSTGAGGGSPIVGAVTAEILVWGKKASRGKDIAALSLFGSSEGNRSDKAKLKGQGAGEVLFPPGTKFKTRKFDAFDRNGKPALIRTNERGALDTRSFQCRIEVEEV